MKNRNVLRSTALLTLSGIAAKTIDFVFRSYYSRQLGSEGLGLFSLCFAVHGIMLNIASGGFGVAVSKIISERLSNGEIGAAKGTMRLALSMVGTLSVCAILVTCMFSKGIATRFLNEPECAKSLVCLAPSIFFMGISYCLKGYFYASRKVFPPASSEFLEQAVKIVSITYLLSKMLSKGVEQGCEAVFLGISIGEFSSCLYLSVIYMFDIGRFKDIRCAKLKNLAAPLFKIALPVALGAVLGSFIRMREQVLTVEALEGAGLSHKSALKLYGGIYGMAMPMIVFPLTLLSSCFTMLVPEISRAYSAASSVRLKTLTSRIYRLCGFFGFLVMCVMFVFSRELSVLVYGTTECAGYLNALSLLAPVMFLDSVSCGILNGMGKQSSMFLYGILDALGRSVMIVTFVPVCGVKALFLIIICSNIFTCTLTAGKAHMTAKVHFGWIDRFLKHGLSALIAGFVSGSFSHMLFSGDVVVFGGIFLTILVYSVADLCLSNALRADFGWVKGRMFFNT
ncbi:MAG: oligosaccharide flippase family protein [Clostridia bacterium]|nr:oligosaccharide flippase family protein [Clostridia bacterium]